MLIVCCALLLYKWCTILCFYYYCLCNIVALLLFVAAKHIIAEDESTGLYQYFIRVIPTIYTNEFGYQTYTNQYTITDRFRPLNLPGMNDNKVSSSKLCTCNLLCLLVSLSSVFILLPLSLSSPHIFYYIYFVSSFFPFLFFYFFIFYVDYALATRGCVAGNFLRVWAVPLHDRSLARTHAHSALLYKDMRYRWRRVHRVGCSRFYFIPSPEDGVSQRSLERSKDTKERSDRTGEIIKNSNFTACCCAGVCYVESDWRIVHEHLNQYEFEELAKMLSCLIHTVRFIIKSTIFYTRKQNILIFI